jgi:hypothetical protein
MENAEKVVEEMKEKGLVDQKGGEREGKTRRGISLFLLLLFYFLMICFCRN